MSDRVNAPAATGGFDLFAAEQAALAQARQTLSAPDATAAVLHGELAALSDAYAKLIGEYRKLNRLADRREERLRHLNVELDAARAEADRASAAKSAWLAHMSHEIRTPLNGVIANLDLLRLAELGPDQRELADAAGVSAHTLLEIVGDVLDLSKIEAGRLDLDQTRFDLPGVVAAATAIVEPRCRARGLRFTALLDPDLPRHLIGDPLRLKQILINLLGNAVKFTEIGGVFLQISGRSLGDPRRIGLRIEVSDTGSGFDPAVAERLFEAFAQAEAATARLHGGSGLGLAICRRLVMLMGGQIGCTACPGAGALFWVELDLPRAAEESDPHLPPDLVGKRILLHASEPSSADRLAAAMGQLGARVVRDSAAAIAGLDAVVLWSSRTALAPATVASLHDQWGVPVVAIAPADLAGRLRLLRAGAAWGFDAADPVETLARRVAQLAAASRPLFTASLGADRGELRATLPILVVDDTPMNREIARRQLTALGLTPVTVDNGAEALKLCRAGRYAAILTDWAMPVMDGLTFTRHLRALEAESGRRTPVICVTAHALAGESEVGRAAGMDGYLTKPVTLERLRAVLTPLLNGRPPAAGNELRAPAVGLSRGALDFERLDEIFGTTEPARLRRYLEMFPVDSAPVLVALRAALRREARRELSDSAHELKGLAANIAAIELAEVAGSMELAAPDATVPVLLAIEAEVLTLHAAAVNAIRALSA